MNRHTRRAQAKQKSPSEGPDDSVTLAAARPPSIGLRLFARLLLAGWVIKRINHPDLVAILVQIARQVGRPDAIAQLMMKGTDRRP